MANASKPQPQDQLAPEDFPLRAEQDKVTKQDGKPVARTGSDEMAREIAERLNCEEHRREEDKWSA